MWRSSFLLTPELRSDTAPFPGQEPAHALQSRIRELERERSEAARHTERLLAVQRAMVQISTARGAQDIISNLLRGAYDALGYSRAIYFCVDRDGISAHAQVDGSDRVEPSRAVATFGSDSLSKPLRRGSFVAPDRAHGVPPVKDVRGAYALSPLMFEMRTLGMLYVDDQRMPAGKAGEDTLLGALTAVAAAALGNGMLLTDAIELATIDPLTGLLNRRAVAERLSVELEMCRNGARALTYVMVDVDDLKKINDTRGHAEGDATLKNVAAILRRSSRAQDVVGRFGGDEFVIMLSGVDRDLARALVTRLSQNLRAQNLSCSIGAASLGAEAVDEPSLARCADRALYAAKAAGKNGFSFA